MRLALLIPLALLAACGGKPTTTVVSKDGTTVTAGPNGELTVRTENETVVATAGAPSCADKPDYAPVYAGASITACVSGNAVGRHSGSINYGVNASPETVLAWSKAEAEKAGFKQQLLSPTMYSAADGAKRSLAVIVTAEASGSRVIVNWGQAD